MCIIKKKEKTKQRLLFMTALVGSQQFCCVTVVSLHNDAVIQNKGCSRNLWP